MDVKRDELRRLQFLLDALNDRPRTAAGDKLAKIINAINGRPIGQWPHVNRELDSLSGRLHFIPRPGAVRGFVWSVFNGENLSLLLTEGIDLITRMLVLRRVQRIRECRCGTWFFGKRENHMFCSDSCRDKEFRSTPEGKKKRRLYMKRYRAQPSNRGGPSGLRVKSPKKRNAQKGGK